MQVWLAWHDRDKFVLYLFPGGVVLCRVCSDWAFKCVCVFLCVSLSMLDPKTADSTLRSQGPLKWTEPNHCSLPTDTDLYTSSASQSLSSIDQRKGSKNREKKGQIHSFIVFFLFFKKILNKSHILRMRLNHLCYRHKLYPKSCVLLRGLCYYFCKQSTIFAC